MTSPSTPVEAHLLAIASLPDIGPATVLRCLRTDPASAWSAVRAGRAASHPGFAPLLARVGADRAGRLQAAARELEPEVLLAAHRAAGCELLVHGQEGYPDRLLHDPAPPPLLIVRGRRLQDAGPAVAIVGTRNATRAGTELAASLAAGLVRCGVAVVSGLALGIDGAAHRGALAEHEADDASAGGADDRRTELGMPIGVIASGLDIAYPQRHRRLQEAVAGTGVLLSETPLGGRPLPWRFPARNRLIAGLADAVVVVESRATGGSMITAAEALARDVHVLAVPGHPTVVAAAGTNDLLADGATIVRDLDDVLVAIGLGGLASASTGPARADRDRSPEERAVLDVLAGPSVTFEEVLLASGLPFDRAAEVLVALEADGAIVRTGGWIERTGQPGGAASQVGPR